MYRSTLVEAYFTAIYNVMSWNAHEAGFTTEQIPFPYTSSPVTSAQSLTPV